MEQEDNSLEQGIAETPYDSSLELQQPGSEQISSPTSHASRGGPGLLSPFRLNRLAFLLTAAVLMFITLIGAGSFLLSSLSSHGSKQSASPKPNNFSVGNLQVQNVSGDQALQLGEVSHLEVNGQLRVSNSVVLVPSSAPTSPTAA